MALQLLEAPGVKFVSFSNPVIIYSTPTCQFCHAAKHLLDQYRVPYHEFDVSSNQQAAQDMISKSGQSGTPVIDINGAIIVGYDPRQIIGALQYHGYVR